MSESFEQVHFTNIIQQPHHYLSTIISKTAFRLYGHWINHEMLENTEILQANTPKKQKQKSTINDVL